jgi:hypothetical protein
MVFILSLPDAMFSDATVFSTWNFMKIDEGTSQGIYYTITDHAPNRIVIFAYLITRYQSKDAYYHFQISFFEANPGNVRLLYLQVPDGGRSAIVGVQG